MFYSITGKLIISEPYHIVIECGGIGYSIKTSLISVSKMPSLNEQVTIYTYLAVREDAVDLYGFCDTIELNSFKMLISVSGVGPKAACAILSDLTSERLALCIASEDAKALTKAQGVGLKTAQRIVLELKDKISKEQLSEGISSSTVSDIAQKSGNASEAITALEVLGFSRVDATAVITKLDNTMPVEEMIKYALKVLA